MQHHLETMKTSVHRLTDHLQCVMGYLETENYKKALECTKNAIKELRGLATLLSGTIITMPKHGSVVVVPHGTTVVESDDVTGTVHKDTVEVVDAHRMKPGKKKDDHDAKS